MKRKGGIVKDINERKGEKVRRLIKGGEGKEREVF